MSERQFDSGPGAISRFRAVILATLRVKQLRRGSKPRIELDHKKHKDTCIAMEEVRRGLISYTESAAPKALGDLKAGVEEPLPVVGSIAPFNSFTPDQGL